VRDRRKYLLLIAVILAALVGALMIEIPGSPAQKHATLGLDLKGGLEVVLQAGKVKGKDVSSSDLDTAVSIMRQRIDALGVSEPEIRKQEPNQIVIQLAGIHDPRKAAKVIGQTAQLELYDLEKDLASPSVDTQGNPIPFSSRYLLLKPVQSLVKAKGSSEWYLFDKKNKLIAGPTLTRAGLFTKDHPKAVNGEQVFGVPKGTVIITCGSSDPKTAPAVCPGQNASPLLKNFYLFKYHPSANPKVEGIPELTGRDLNPDGVRQDVNPTTNQSVVRLAFHSHGDHEFQTVTRRLYQRGQLRQTPQHFAIVLDRDIKSFPQIDYTDSSLSDGIAGGGEIEGVTPSEAHDLALVLKYGALPIPFTQVERSDVSATLGADSLQQAKTAALFGLLIVAIFLLIFYRFLGVVAVLGLAIYSAFLYAAILILNVTITLPGFAGLILTIGVAADANVVIFERIKEEVAAGKSVRAAVATGYQKGFHTIVDANVVTAITALVLFAVATAQVKGFALMLLLGTVISLVTAVFATRAMLGLLAGFRWFDNPHFMGARGQQIPKWQQIDVNGPRRRRVFLSIATFAILLSVVFIVVKGLNLGIDFKGGTQISFNTPQAVTLSKIRDQTTAIGRSDAVVQGRGSAFGTDSYKSFQLRMKSLKPAQQDRLTKNLEDQLHITKLGVKSVSSSFSRQIARDAILAVIVSFALILLYVTLRYQWRFAVPILRTLFSDILITVGVYALSGREVTTATVAAVLTVLGYSIYDTIIVFDRVRENMPRMQRFTFAEIANRSVWEVLRRSMATSFITLLPIACLLIFGGETLKDFAFALFIGISVGAVSTIFVATPFLTVLMERSPEFKRRGQKVERERERERGAEALEPEPEPVPAAVAVEADDGDGVAEEPEPAVAGAAPAPADGASSRSQSKRERRRQRRSTRPHGRAR
jgi:SecD/SecF fusion protein